MLSLFSKLLKTAVFDLFVLRKHSETLIFNRLQAKPACNPQLGLAKRFLLHTAFTILGFYSVLDLITSSQTAKSSASCAFHYF